MIMKKKTRSISRRGFTLLELIVALGIFSLLIGSVTWIVVDAFRSNRVIWKQLERQSDGRKVLQEVVNNIRKAEMSSVGAYPIEFAGINEIRFYANIDTDGYKEKVRFFLVGTDFQRGIIKPSGNPLAYDSANEDIVVLARNVTNLNKNIPVFSYFDQNYTGLEAPLTQPVVVSDIRVVRIFLELEDDPDKTPVALSVESTVAIRNLKTN